MDVHQKSVLYQKCQEYVQHRIDGIREAIALSQDSANEETKSSAGDKYETGRAMMQLEIEKLTAQLNEASRVAAVLAQISPDTPCSEVLPGSLVTTSMANYYISVSAGKIVIDGVIYYAIAPDSPLAQVMRRKRAGESFTFQNKTVIVHSIA